MTSTKTILAIVIVIAGGRRNRSLQMRGIRLLLAILEREMLMKAVARVQGIGIDFQSRAVISDARRPYIVAIQT